MSDKNFEKGIFLIQSIIFFSIFLIILTLTRAQAQTTGICDRTQQVQDAILAEISEVDDCALVTSTHLASITRLSLDNESITSLQSGDFAGLSSLGRLELYGNSLTTLPSDVFSNLSSLTVLQLSYNSLSELPSNVFSNLSSLEELNVSHNGLSELPSDVFSNLSSLRSLYLDGNKLNNLPSDVFSNLSSLRILFLYGNELTALPSNVFSNLSSLNWLDLYGNSLDELPSNVFSNLSSLKHLDLSENNLSELPSDVFSSLSPLTKLLLSNNKLSELPDGLLRGLSMLEVFWSHGNAVDPMPISVSLSLVANGQFKITLPSGAPFNIAVPLTVINGNINGNDRIAIPVGTVESDVLTVTRLSAPGAVTVDIESLPNLPTTAFMPYHFDINRAHHGYALTRSADLPLVVIDGTPTLTIANVLATESNGAIVFTVRLSPASSEEVSVDYETQAGTATEGTDYTRMTGRLTFPANSTPLQEIRVPIINDAIVEPDETFTIKLSNAQNATLVTTQATGTIINDDGGPPPPPPPALAAPVVTRALATSMVINWQRPEGPISGYDLRYRESGTTDFIDGPQDIIRTRIILMGLDPDTEYEIQIRASNSSGDGEWSELKTVQTSTSIPQDRFSLSLDMDDAEGEQFSSFVAVSSDGLASIQIFGKNLNAIPANDLSIRVEYEATQVIYEGFKRGPVLSGTYALSGKGFVNIGMTLRETGDDSGLLGTLRFRPTDALSETEIRLVWMKLLQGRQSETIPMFLSVALQGTSVASPTGKATADFNRNGIVDIPDFLLFVDVFGLTAGQEKYEAKYDLDRNDEIGIPDFLIFVEDFGKEVSHVPVFKLELPVLRFVEENTPSGQPIGEPILAKSADGEPLTYSLWGIDAEYFSIDASTGQLETKEAYNYEVRNWYAPIVRVTDGKGRQVSVVVSVAIIDVAE